MYVYGCSLTKDNYIDTWADILALKLNLSIENFAERGAGYEYVSTKVITSAVATPDVLHIIMWPTADRFDLWVNSSTPHLQNDVRYASWLDGTKPQFVNEDGIYNNDRGWYINGAAPRGLKHKYYKYFYSHEYHVNHAWKTILLTQKYLNELGSKYIMASAYPLTNLIQYHEDSEKNFNQKIFQQIDLNKFVDCASEQGFIQFSIKNKENFFNPHYPDSNAHKHYVDKYLIPKINEIL